MRQLRRQSQGLVLVAARYEDRSKINKLKVFVNEKTVIVPVFMFVICCILLRPGETIVQHSPFTIAGATESKSC